MDSNISNSNYMCQRHDRAAEIDFLPFFRWRAEMLRFRSKFPGWRKEMRDLEMRVQVAERREECKSLGMDPGSVWVPFDYVEEAPEAGAQ